MTTAGFAQDGMPEPKPLDKDQQTIVEQVLRKIIEDIKGLKGKYPELEHFGEKPWFTREPGDFRYDYKIAPPIPGEDNSKAKPLAGGCGMYFSLTAEYSPNSKWENYYTFRSGGGARAGIWFNFSITTNEPHGVLEDAVSKVINAEIDDSFERLAGEYVLQKHGVKQDATGAVIDALRSGDADVCYSAIRVLTTRKLVPAEFALIREGYMQGKYPASFGFYYMMEFLKTQDGGHLPDFCLGMAELTLRMEAEGKDTFERTPDTWGWASDARIVREGILKLFETDERLAPAVMVILNGDTDLQNRLRALDELSKLPAKQRDPDIVAALGNTFRSVQAKAAELAGTLHADGGRKELEALLISPSLKVRTAANEALGKLGFQKVKTMPVRALPEGVARIADTLWQNGLREEDVVKICAQPEKRAFNPLTPRPEKSALPEGVVLYESKSVDQNGKPVPNPMHDYFIELTDPWRMNKMDAPSVKKRASQFVVGIGKDWITSIMDPTGAFLIAATMKQNDTAMAQAVYERLCDKYQTDDDILYDGFQGLGWERIQPALNLFKQGKDDDALKAFAEVTRLAKSSRPFTYLGGYMKLTDEVIADIERRKQEVVKPAPAPVFSSAKDCKQYWREKIPDKKERIAALIAQLENVKDASTGWDVAGGGFSLVLTLAAEGDDAVEPLLDCVLHDERLTRDMEMNMDHSERPERWVTKVRSEAIDVLDRMFGTHFVNVSNETGFMRGDTATLEKITEDVRERRDALARQTVVR